MSYLSDKYRPTGLVASIANILTRLSNNVAAVPGRVPTTKITFRMANIDSALNESDVDVFSSSNVHKLSCG